MFFSKNENPIGSIENAARKGKRKGNQSLCKVGAAKPIGDPDKVILRTEDANGTAPIIILLTKEQAQQLSEMLIS